MKRLEDIFNYIESLQEDEREMMTQVFITLTIAYKKGDILELVDLISKFIERKIHDDFIN